ncbi:MAG: hypothetical protein ACK2T7_09125 [Anaerolineales bacterium]
MKMRKLRHGLLLFGAVLALTALGCKFLTDLILPKDNEPVAVQVDNQEPIDEPDEEPAAEPIEEPDVEPAPQDDSPGEQNGAGPDLNDEVELNIGGIQLFYDPNLIEDIQGEWKEASGGLMSEPWPASMHYDLLLDAGTMDLVEVFALEHASASYELAIGEIEDLLRGQPTQGLDCIPEVARDTAVQQCSHQQFVSNIKYLKFKNGEGVRWVTVYAIQDAVAVSNEYLVYRFQGLTDNGECHLSASFHITHDQLPDAAMLPDDVYTDMTGDLLNAYFEGFQMMLDYFPEGFMPPLEHFDAMIESLAVGVCGAG